ncbi:UDP-N-acetylglucosamine--N-acetylmuramyl-(pentapeptide) pyrophosphoryl-undecaprenol N-acetylglucosamine transferase [Candidatus Daviesbacteria bacterium]|nr:UDP-N-acetylglucosamine--N-acetylmuramyl-(pentapeptide) pyrophosphoryl-undecaprenol N-acetylglucosamine transferase [Candidatus Daviesbacteria bacterium]
MKILITGAHFTPAIAVIEELKKFKGVEIIYVGRKTTMEGDQTQSQESIILPETGVKFISIITGRWQRVFTPYTIPSLLKIPIGFIQSFWIILSEKPDVILSFGGYVSVPVVFAGWLFSIPVIIHEPALLMGLANKICSPLANKIALSFKNQNVLDGKIIATGNPLRDEILHPSGDIDLSYKEIFQEAKKSNLPTILITGGNQGSHIINLAIEHSLDKILKIACVIHVTGESKFHDFERLQKKQHNRYLVKKWIGKEWGIVLSKADLAISRAGINTLTEFAFFRIPALVIPIPYLYGDEQNKNARYFEKLGLVKILPQSKLSEALMKNVKIMLNNINSLKKEAERAQKFIIPDAAKRLALETVLLVK